MKKVKRKFIVLLILLDCLILVAFVYYFKNISNLGSALDNKCKITQETKIVEGNSMTPYLQNEEQVIALMGYYNCHPILRDDVVLIQYGNLRTPLIKFVKALPGDKFQLIPAIGGWYIVINGQILKNSENKLYLVNGNRYKMLALYEHDYQGVIPQNAYLVLGDLVNGSKDSTTFGLINNTAIIAKVIKIK